MDKTGQDTLAEVQKASDWQSMSDWQGWGFGQEPVWVRIHLNAAPKNANEPWVVLVRPAFLDYVTLYDPATGLVLRTGDALAPDSNGFASINFNLQIPALPYERTVYLQIRSTSSRILNIEILPIGQAGQQNRLQEWVLGFVGAASAIFAIWAWAQWWFTREKVILAFAVKQVAATIWAFFWTGFARVVIGPNLTEGVLTTLASTFFVWTVSVTFWFFSVLVQSYQPWRPAFRVLQLFVALVFLLPLFQWMVPVHSILAVANASVLVGFVLLLFVLGTAIPKQVKQPIPLPVLMAYLLAYSALISLPIPMVLGWTQARPVALLGTMVHVVLDGLVMFVMLQIRARSLRQEQMQVTLDLHRSLQQAEDDKRHREEQSQLFAMLAHEMKTPLAALRLWMDAGELKQETLERAINDMNQVIERCVHAGQLADQGLQPIAQKVSPIELTRACIQACRSPERVNFVEPASDDPVYTDAQMLSIVLGNLLDNACKYGASQAPIEVTLRPLVQGNCPGWRWQVRNLAGPASLPDVERLFAKYYRSPHARRISGSGLGLFLVRGLLELMQGSVAYTAQGDHAVFSFWVPAQLAPR